MSPIQYSLRQLLKNPTFTTVALVILALGIGANATVFTLINAVVLKPMSGSHADRLVGIYSEDSTHPGTYRGFSHPEFKELQSRGSVLEHVFAFSPGQVGITEGDLTRREFALHVSANYFSAFGAPVSLGRDFTADEERSGDPVVIVSHGWWERHGSPADVIGRSLTVNGRPVTIIGVTARGFAGTTPVFPPELFLPLVPPGASPASIMDPSHHELFLVGALRPGISLQDANAQLAVVGVQWATANPGESRNQVLSVARLPRLAINTAPSDDHGILAGLSALLIAMSCAVLLIACLNLANLLLARGTARRKEIAIRLALGASRGAILRQLMVEGWILALAGGVFGLTLAAGTANVLVSSLNRISPSRLALDPTPDFRVLGAGFLTCLLATVFFALGPAWRLSRTDVNSDLKDAGSGGTKDGRTGLFAGRHLLVVAQISLTLALLVAAGLFTRGAIRAVNVQPGFQFDSGFYLQLDAGLVGYSESRTRQLYAQILDRVRSLPGVESASLAATIPLGELALGEGVQRAGAPTPPPSDAGSPAEGKSIGANYNVVGPDYFRTLGVPMLRGREFERAELFGTNLPRVVILNSVLAEKLWPGEDPLGRRVQFASPTVAGGKPNADRSLEVVGIVSPFRAHLSDHTPSPMVFVPGALDYRSDMSLHVRTRPGASASDVLQSARTAVRNLDPVLPVLAAKTLRFHVESNLQVWIIRTGALLFAAMGLVALSLAMVGIYGVKAYAVARRTREIGIRMALGASRGTVERMVLREGLHLTLLGLGIGFVLAGLAAQAAGRFLFEVQPLDPIVFLTAPCLLAIPAMLASWLPARRAAQVDPLVALRTE